MAVLSWGCGSAAAPSNAPTAPEREPEPLYTGPLVDYVPAGGVQWLLLGKPLELAQNQQLTKALEPLLPASRLDLYARSTGVDLRTLDNALVAGFGLGTLYLAETHTDQTLAQRAFSERLVNGPREVHPHPRLIRITGVVGRTPQSLLSYQGQLLAVAVGDTTTVRIVEAFARGKLRRTKRVFDGVALSSFAEFANRAPLVFLAPGPFDGKWMYGARGLLAVANGVGLSAQPLETGNLAITIAIDGPWDEQDASPVARLRQAWEDLAESSTGQLFGLQEPVSLPALSANGRRVSLTVELKLAPIVNGLRAAVAADVWEMLELGPTSTHDEGPEQPG